MSKKTLTAISILAMLTLLWLVWRPARWADEIPASSPYPVPDQDVLPILLFTRKLPAFQNLKSPKPVVAADGNGAVVVASYGSLNNVKEILVRRSTDRGETWGQAENITGSGAGGDINFDAWLETDGHGVYYLVYVHTSDPHLILRHSKDSAASWSGALPVSWKAADRPVLGVSPNGMFLVVAAAMSEKSANAPTAPLAADDPNLQQIVRASVVFHDGVFVSTDHGENWDQWTSPFGDRHAIPFAVVVDDTGRVAASWIVKGDGSQSAISISADHGRTWTNTTLIDSLQPDRPHPFNGERFPVVALDDSGGLHVAYVNGGATSLMVRSSADWEKWTQATVLSSDAAEEVRMAAVDARGPMVHVTWFERNGGKWNAYYRGSRDSAMTWSPRLCLSESIVLADGTVAEGFQMYGDDDQSSVRDDGLGRVHAVWCNRSGEIIHAVVDWSPKRNSAEHTDEHEPE